MQGLVVRRSRGHSPKCLARKRGRRYNAGEGRRKSNTSAVQCSGGARPFGGMLPRRPLTPHPLRVCQPQTVSGRRVLVA